ncbi:morphogenic membrane protein MmpB [Streptomyces sp. MAR4 CNX-425]
MLWSDPPDEPDDEFRAAERQLRRAGWLVALAAVVTIALGAAGLGVLPT